MSALPPGLAPAISTIGALVQATLISPSNVMRAFTPQDSGALGASGVQGPPQPFPGPTVWVEEHHQDNTIITEHPVEGGAPITDHAFQRPGEVTIRLGWKGESATALQGTYTQILGMQAARVLFDIQTGKRLYSNMLIAGIQVMTDQRSEKVLLATVRCKQVILVNTKIISVPADSANQAQPSSTAPPQDRGSTPLIPGDNFNPAGTPFGAPGHL